MILRSHVYAGVLVPVCWCRCVKWVRVIAWLERVWCVCACVRACFQNPNLKLPPASVSVSVSVSVSGETPPPPPPPLLEPHAPPLALDSLDTLPHPLFLGFAEVIRCHKGVLTWLAFASTSFAAFSASGILIASVSSSRSSNDPPLSSQWLHPDTWLQ